MELVHYDKLCMTSNWIIIQVISLHSSQSEIKCYKMLGQNNIIAEFQLNTGIILSM